MANCCDLDMHLLFDSDEHAADFEKEVRVPGGPSYTGGAKLSDDRYVFDGETVRHGSEVSVLGWVKWGLEDWELMDLVRRFPGVASLRAEMREDGNRIKCVYRWGRAQPDELEYTWLPVEDWPEWKDEYGEDPEAWDERLEDAYDSRQRCISIPFEGIEEERKAMDARFAQSGKA